jgi:hypothetical protein
MHGAETGHHSGAPLVFSAITGILKAVNDLQTGRKWMSIDSKLPNNICQKELKAIYLRLKHYTV